MKNYLSDFGKMLKLSLKKIGLSTLVALLLDLILIAFLLFSISLWMNMLMSRVMNISSLPLGNILNLDETQLGSMYSFLAWVLIALIGGLFLILASFLALYTLFKGFVWSKIFEKKMKIKLFFKYYAFNLAFAILLILPIVSFVVQNKGMIDVYRTNLIIMIVSFVFLFIYFSELFLFYIIYTEKFFRSIAMAFFFSFKRFHLVFPYYALFAAGFALIIFACWLIPPSIRLIILAIAELSYMAFSRILFGAMLEKYLSKDIKDKEDDD